MFLGMQDFDFWPNLIKFYQTYTIGWFKKTFFSRKHAITP